jgi:hypothetical protein
MAAIPAAVARYREKVANLGAMKDIEAAREVIRESPATCPRARARMACRWHSWR